MRTVVSRFPGQFSEDEATIEARMRYGLTPSRGIMRLQAHANAQAAAKRREASLSSLTYAKAVQDANDALTGLADDLAGNTPRKSLKDMVTHNNRMRGLGILLIALAMVGLVVDYIMGPGTA